MPAKKRNFWILLTVVGLLFSMHTCMQRHQNTPSDIPSKKCNIGALNDHQSPSPPLYTPNIDEFIYVDRLPYPTNKVEIEYEVKSRFSSQHSCLIYSKEQAIIRVLVNEKGQYEAHKVIKYANSFSEDFHSILASSLQFRPAIRDGKPIKYWLNVPLHLATN